MEWLHILFKELLAKLAELLSSRDNLRCWSDLAWSSRQLGSSRRRNDGRRCLYHLLEMLLMKDFVLPTCMETQLATIQNLSS